MGKCSARVAAAGAVQFGELLNELVEKSQLFANGFIAIIAVDQRKQLHFVEHRFAPELQSGPLGRTPFLSR